MERKNVLLQPLFRDLKSQIRTMSYTPEYQLINEYLTSRETLVRSLVHKSPATQKLAEESLKTAYADLMRLHNKKIIE